MNNVQNNRQTARSAEGSIQEWLSQEGEVSVGGNRARVVPNWWIGWGGGCAAARGRKEERRVENVKRFALTESESSRGEECDTYPVAPWAGRTAMGSVKMVQE
jgi:hypothetical protein